MSVWDKISLLSRDAPGVQYPGVRRAVVEEEDVAEIAEAVERLVNIDNPTWFQRKRAEGKRFRLSAIEELAVAICRAVERAYMAGREDGKRARVADRVESPGHVLWTYTVPPSGAVPAIPAPDGDTARSFGIEGGELALLLNGRAVTRYTVGESPPDRIAVSVGAGDTLDLVHEP